MEKLKRFYSSLMFGLMAVCAMTLSACSDDDDDNGGGNSTSSVDNPLVNDGGLLLTSISYQSGSSNDMDTYYIYYDAKLRPYKYTYEYDDYAEDVLIIDYDNGKMDMPDYDGASNLSLSFNSKGYITKVKGSWSYSEDGDNFSGFLEWNASYDKDGHLTGITMNNEEKSDEYNDKGISKTTLSWTGGNLVSYNGDTKWYDEDGQVEASASSTGIFTYGTQQNKYKQYPAIIAVSGFEGLFNMGLFGLGPNNLPTSYNEVSVEEYGGKKKEDKENYTSTITINDNGSIDTEIWTSDSDNYPQKYMYSYSDVNSVSKGITRSVAMTSAMSASDKAKRIRDFMHKLPFVPKRRSGK